MHLQRAYNQTGLSADKRESRRLVVDAEIFLKQSEVQLIRAKLSDLSITGFKLVCYTNLDSDKPVLIRLPGIQMLSADIRWMKNEDYGCEFANSLHPAVLERLLDMLLDF